MTITRRTILAAPLILPAATVPVMASPVNIARLPYLAANLRRVTDCAADINAPFDPSPWWHWIESQTASADLDHLDPLDRADLIADIEGMEWDERRALQRRMCGK